MPSLRGSGRLEGDLFNGVQYLLKHTFNAT